ncbi:MAG: hypothetical protein WC782_01955 [Methylococcaceae bacterium]|jgi:hypothetical protein
MNEQGEQPVFESEVTNESIEKPEQDDRYPGSFFRIPGSPITNNTTWSIS